MQTYASLRRNKFIFVLKLTISVASSTSFFFCKNVRVSSAVVVTYQQFQYFFLSCGKIRLKGWPHDAFQSIPNILNKKKNFKVLCELIIIKVQLINHRNIHCVRYRNGLFRKVHSLKYKIIITYIKFEIVFMN